MVPEKVDGFVNSLVEQAEVQGMVEAGIEVGLLVIRTGYFNAAQIIVPFVVGHLSRRPPVLHLNGS